MNKNMNKNTKNPMATDTIRLSDYADPVITWAPDGDDGMTHSGTGVVALGGRTFALILLEIKAPANRSYSATSGKTIQLGYPSRIGTVLHKDGTPILVPGLGDFAPNRYRVVVTGTRVEAYVSKAEAAHAAAQVRDKAVDDSLPENLEGELL